MHPLSVLILFVSCWALMNFWLVPLLHSSWSASDLLGKVKRTATLTLLEKARDLAGVGAITMGVLTVAVGIVALLGEGSAISTKSMMEALSAAYRAVEGFARGYAQFLVWFGVIAGSLALYVCSRNARRRVTEAWRTDAERLRTQLQDDPAAWDSLREEPQYRSRIQRLDELKAMLATESSTQEQRTGAALEAVELLNELAAEKSRTTLDLERTLAGHEAPEMETDRPKSKLLPLLGVIAGPPPDPRPRSGWQVPLAACCSAPAHCARGLVRRTARQQPAGYGERAPSRGPDRRGRTADRPSDCQHRTARTTAD